MPNSSDTFVLDIGVSRACELLVVSEDKLREYNPNEEYVVNFTSNPGTGPKAPNIAFLFAWYDTADQAAAAKTAFNALNNDGTEETVLATNQLTGTDLPSAIISPENVPTASGITGCTVTGQTPNVTEDTDFHGLIGMRQAELEN